MAQDKNIIDDSEAKTKKCYHYYMMTVAILGQSMHYIQAYKIFSSKSAEDVSLVAYIICLFLLVNCLVYGIVHKAKALIYAETLGIMGCVAIVFGILLYF